MYGTDGKLERSSDSASRDSLCETPHEARPPRFSFTIVSDLFSRECICQTVRRIRADAIHTNNRLNSLIRARAGQLRQRNSDLGSFEREREISACRSECNFDAALFWRKEEISRTVKNAILARAFT